MGSIKEIVFDCEKAAPLARFWAQLLEGYDVRPYDHDEIERLAKLGLTPDTDPTVLVDGPGPTLCFQQVASRKYEHNRIHLDVAVKDRAGEIKRLLRLGAVIAREEVDYTVMRDLEGNQFCIVEGPTTG